MKKRTLRRWAALVFAIACALAPLPVSAQQGGTTQYIYDDNGRLHVVILPTGEAAVYEYDAAGNITAIRRQTADTLAIFSFSPHEGISGDFVTFTGTGFGAGISDVSFNGASARIVNVTATTVVAAVPDAATTGLVTITTARGSVTTSAPFTIRGVRVSPSSVRLKFGDAAQFTAQVLPSTLDQSVTWSVNGTNGGNSSVGAITSTGLYTAPNKEYASLTIRATSLADPLRFAEAQVQVRNPNDVQSVLSLSVSVNFGTNADAAALTHSVAVQYGLSADSQAALAKPVAVQNGNASGVTTALSAGVSVQLGNSTQTTALTNPVSIRYGSASDQNSAASAVSATTGPYIQTISPNQIARGATATLLLNGVGLGGATALRFIDSSGAIDASLTVTNITVNADGTSLTATLSVGGSVALGRRVVVVSTPSGDSQTFDVGSNTLQIVGP